MTHDNEATPIELPATAALGDEAGEGDGGLSLSSPADQPRRNANRGGRP